MDILVHAEYLGYDENNKPLINWDASGCYVLGIYSNIQATCICVVKVYDKKERWDIVEDYTIKGIDVDSCIDKTNYFINKYKIEHVFGNQISTCICEIENHFGNDNEQLTGYEIIELQNEHMMFLAQGNLKKICLKPELKDEWENEFNSFTIQNLRHNDVTYPRLFALANVLHGAKPAIWYLLSPDIPNVVINSKTGAKTKKLTTRSN